MQGEAISPLAPERRLGKYTLRREVGRGGMSVVWEASDNDLQRRVALKLLTASRRDPLAGDAEVHDQELTRFIREAQTAAKLHHPSIVKVHEAGSIEGVFFIAMGFLELIIADCTRCIEKEPGLWRPWLFRARAHRGRAAFDPERADYQKATQVGPHLEAQVRTELEEMAREEKR